MFISLVIVVHESLVCPEQLNFPLFFRKILQLTQILWFSSIFVYLNPFQQRLYDFEIHLFTPRTTEGLICNYYRRIKHSPILQKEKICIKSRGVKTFEQNGDEDVLFVLRKYHIFFHLYIGLYIQIWRHKCPYTAQFSSRFDPVVSVNNRERY